MKAIGSLKNDWSIHAVARAVSEHLNRGIATAEKVETVLRDIKEDFGIRNVNKLDEEKVNEIARDIAERVQEGEITGKTGADYFSALNAIIDYVNHNFDKDIEQLKYSDFDIHKETDYRDKSISEETHNNFQSFLEEKYQETGDTRFQTLEYATELQREFGLRFRESAGLNINTIREGLETGKLHLDRTDWTKNAREREIEIKTPEQKELLQNIKNYMEEKGIVNLAGAENWRNFQPIAEFRAFSDNIRQEFNREFSQNFHFHQERHSWAQNMYRSIWQEKTGTAIQSPIQYYSEQLEKAGWTSDSGQKFYDAVKEYEIKSWWDYASKELPEYTKQEIKLIDKEIRIEISSQLGHSRLDITNTYLGHP